MPTNVGVMALTATASQPLRQQVEATLGMRNPFTIIRSPDKCNIRFSVVQVKGYNGYDVPKVFDLLLTKLKMKLTLMPRVMIFCKAKSDYIYILKCFWDQFFDILLVLQQMLLEFDLLTCFTKVLISDVKSTIIDNFTKQSCLRIVICTDAFGMGIDYKNVRCIIHYRVPNDMETYVPQIGRGGREEIDSYVVMLHVKRLLEICEGNMLDYVKNKSQCRCDMLFREFEKLCSL
ncbi:PREDICTED: uncharacterized protein LOC105315366 [Amphimedon queenslandica]|uniref:DNA 3'-5' helicase n=2 Tax=Amphimedon queenslandica TaxID=400682 RepID=A0AAN0ISQ8_AMPQE|nr:PREDICTED: uncharacterized protein LOC105315366 [Amphimedon queenslandica]|eukprot:XP_011408286.1 PREDICTED: uncharacterized protein LOC105315366 [Amphimedon queenslandica]